MRTFIDETGMEWTAWEVRPGLALAGVIERRSGADRRGSPPPDPVIERRGWRDRRRQAARLARVLGATIAAGWLVFQMGGVRRRLTPVPPGWEQLADRELAALCRRAAPAPVAAALAPELG